MLTFTDDTPPPRYRWDGVLEELRQNPGKWAYVDDIGRRTADHLRQRWADLPVDITQRDIDRQGRGVMWLRWRT